MSTLVAGAAEVDVTPDNPRGTYLGGFGFNRKATGVLEPLTASALYVSDGEREVALVTVDSVGLLHPTVDAIRDAVETVPPSAIVVSATHTHAGPDTIGFWGPTILGVFPRKSGCDPDYMAKLVSQVAKAIDRAKANAKPATMRATTFEVPPEWTRNDRDGGGRYDDGVVLAVDDADGERIATMLNYASHPEALWEDNTLISPDFVGAFRRHMTELDGGVSLYFTGPLGAMLTPNVNPKASAPERQDYIERMGRAIAEATARALDDVESSDEGAVRVDTRPITFRNRNWRYTLLQRLGVVTISDVDPGLKQVTSEVHRVRVGPVSILTAPGEVVPELGHRVVALDDAPHTMLFCLCGDEFGYILEPSMFDDREYGYEQTMSLGRETADTLLGTYRQLLAG